jgi:hypothetical protein
MVGYAGILVFCGAVAALGFITWLKRRSDRLPVSALPKQISYWPEPEPSRTAAFVLQALARLVVTLVILGAVLCILLHQRYGDTQQKWATAAVGIIIGYWLKT